jgi:L-fuculose-phosphate aldolase
VPDSIAPFVKEYNAVLLANHGALSWGRDVYEAFFRLESVEYYASLLMYTGNIIGKQNPLSCDQVQVLLNNRSKYGITSGGTPPCSCETTNMQDVITNVVTGSGTQAEPDVSKLKGVTPIVRPGDSSAVGCGCGSIPVQTTGTGQEKTKEEIIAEVVRRVTQQMKQ